MGHGCHVERCSKCVFVEGAGLLVFADGAEPGGEVVGGGEGVGVVLAESAAEPMECVGPKADIASAATT